MAAAKKPRTDSLDEIEARAKRRNDAPALRLIKAIREADKQHKNKLHDSDATPKVGDDIYVPGAWYIDHGEDDVEGGLAEISKVEVTKRADGDMIFVSVKELPGRSYNWKPLQAKQKELKKQYGKNRARPDPDYG